MKIIHKARGRKGQKGRDCKYDSSVKQKIAKDYIEGTQSLTQLGKIYNVPHQTISRWARQFSSELAGEIINIPPMTEQEERELIALQDQVDALKKKLDYEQMRIFALETMIDLAKTEFGVDLRKNSGAKQPKE